MDDYWRDFVEESEENITELNNLLLELERRPDDSGVLDRIFRSAHTLKGNSGAMGLEDANDLAHAMEDLLDAVRAGEVEVTPELMDTIFDAVDGLEAMVEEVAVDGRIETDPTPTIEALRAPLDEAAARVSRPSDEEIESTLSRFEPPSDDHDAYMVRLAIADSGELNNGLLVVEALIDAFDLIGTEPPRPDIECGDYERRIDAVFGSAVGEDAIAAALEPVDAVDDFEIITVTDRFDTSDSPAESVSDPLVDHELTADISSDEANEMSVDELLDEFEELDDIDALAEEIDDVSEFENLGEAGSFDEIMADAEPEQQPEPTGSETVDDVEDDVSEDDPSDAQAPEDDVEDAGAVFEELKDEVDMVGFDELQEELDELEFDQFDDEEEIGMDELLGDDVDVGDSTFLEVEDEPAAPDVDPVADVAVDAPTDDELEDTVEDEASGDAADGLIDEGADEDSLEVSTGLEEDVDLEETDSETTPSWVADAQSGSAESSESDETVESPGVEADAESASEESIDADTVEDSAFADSLFGGEDVDEPIESEDEPSVAEAEPTDGVDAAESVESEEVVDVESEGPVDVDAELEEAVEAEPEEAVDADEEPVDAVETAPEEAADADEEPADAVTVDAEEAVDADEEPADAVTVDTEEAVDADEEPADAVEADAEQVAEAESEATVDVEGGEWVEAEAEEAMDAGAGTDEPVAADAEAEDPVEAEAIAEEPAEVDPEVEDSVAVETEAEDSVEVEAEPAEPVDVEAETDPDGEAGVEEPVGSEADDGVAVDPVKTVETEEPATAESTDGTSDVASDPVSTDATSPAEDDELVDEEGDEVGVTAAEAVDEVDEAVAADAEFKGDDSLAGSEGVETGDPLTDESDFAQEADAGEDGFSVVDDGAEPDEATADIDTDAESKVDSPGDFGPGTEADEFDLSDDPAPFDDSDLEFDDSDLELDESVTADDPDLSFEGDELDEGQGFETEPEEVSFTEPGADVEEVPFTESEADADEISFAESETDVDGVSFVESESDVTFTDQGRTFDDLPPADLDVEDSFVDSSEATADSFGASDAGFDEGGSFGDEDEPQSETAQVLELLGEMAVPEIDLPERIDQSSAEEMGEHAQSVRVDNEQIDSLLQLVEGLVTSRVRLRTAVDSGADYGTLDSELDDLEEITTELQETVMEVRLVPLQTVTSRLPRVVRDLAREQEKTVVFEQSNEHIELDRSILDRVGDPLIHLIRNAIDHGIEPPDDREAAGKPREGTIELTAERTRDRVEIEITDDGSGLDADRIRQEAIGAEVLTASEAEDLDDDSVYDLVFHPGLSTADEVTDVSGRGVGMDVVRRTVDELNGRVQIESEPGEGTTVTMTLPVSVAIDDVLFVESGGEQFGVPIKVVQDIADAALVESVDGDLVFGETDDESLPVIELADALGAGGSTVNGDGMVVRIRDDVRSVALHCDDVHGRQEVVVKPFEGFMRDVPGLSGATVRGRGQVVTILDVATL